MPGLPESKMLKGTCLELIEGRLRNKRECRAAREESQAFRVPRFGLGRRRTVNAFGQAEADAKPDAEGGDAFLASADAGP